jgi:hypothetical protein
MSKMNRLEMLKRLVQLNGPTSISILDVYLPDYYDQIYSFYSLLVDARMDYINMIFKRPIIETDSFYFCFSLPQNEFEKLASFVAEKGGRIKYMRKKSFAISVEGDCDATKLKFVRICDKKE